MSASDPTLPAPKLELAQLESLRFKAAQIEEALQYLSGLIHYADAPAMPSYPELLAKYGVLVSHMHSLSEMLSKKKKELREIPLHQIPLDQIALHPRAHADERALEQAANQYLNRAQNIGVSARENAAVRRLAACMRTGPGVLDARPAHAEVLAECAEISGAHDARVVRAARAVELLRDQYDWRSRLTVEQEEPEEIEWAARPVERVGGDLEMESESEGSEGDDDEVNQNLGGGTPEVAGDVEMA